MAHSPRGGEFFPPRLAGVGLARPAVQFRSTSRKLLMPYELVVGLRYTLAKRRSGRNGFVSFIAAVSMLGIALGVAALIVVLSVMNGFQDELRTRILSVASHIEIRAIQGALIDWQSVARAAKSNPHVKAAAPYVLGQAMLSAADVN